MYSPLSPRKGVFGSSKNSPRKPLLSPSEINPFSFSTETLNLFDNDQLQQNNGIIPMSMSFPHAGTSGLRVGAHSQPRTPTSGHLAMIHQNVHSAPGRSLSLGGSGSFGGSGSTGGGGGGGIGGRSIREFDETVRELRKENFNLKLRIYFLEERLGTSRLAAAAAGSKEELVQSNYELKFQCESLKYEIREKTDLLAEAGLAIEQLETRLSTLSIEREEERKTLEEKLQQLEDDLGDSAAAQQRHGCVTEPIPFSLSASSSPGQSPAKSGRRKMTSSFPAEDEDETLLHEVEEEMKRGVDYSSPTSSCKESASQTCQPAAAALAPGLGVLEEKDEAMVSRLEDLEQQVEQLTIVIHDTEFCLEQRARQIRELELEIGGKDATIETLKKEKLVKAEEVVKAQKEVSDLSNNLVEQSIEHEKRSKEFESNLRELEQQLRNAKAELDRQATNLQDLLQERDNRLKDLCEELEKSQKEIKSLQEAFDQKPAESAGDPSCQCKSNNKAPTESDYQVFSSPRPRPLSLGSGSKTERGNFQIVTQTLHIPPTARPVVHGLDLENQSGETDGGCDSTNEATKLRRDMRKLKEYLKTSVQERKLLLKKIGTLNERVAEVNLRKSMSPARKVTEKADATVQCIPLTFDKTVESVIQHLSLSCHGADTLRCRLDTVSTCLERDQRELSIIYQPTIDEMRDITRRIVDTVTTAVHILSTIDISDRTDSEIGRRTSSSMSVPYLPDPSEIDLSFVHSQQQQQQQFVDENIRQKLSMFDSMEQQLEEKDKVIRDQHEVLQEYRSELFRLRDSRRNAAGQKLERPKRRFRRSGEGGATRSETAPIVRDPSEEYDTWSEPDVGASRTRMGLSRHVLSLIEKTGHSMRSSNGAEEEEDSSEAEKNRREKRTDDSSQQECEIGSLRCLLNGLHEFSRTMDELAYQVDLSETVDSGNVSGDDVDDDPEPEFDDSEEDGIAASKDFDEFHVDLCHGCSNSLPLELEHCIHRCGALLAGSAFSLQRLRHACCRLRNKLRRRNQQLADKRLLLAQLEESVLPLREKAETAEKLSSDLNSVREDVNKKSREIQELQAKMNDNYKLVAELSAENLKLSSEKLRMEQLVDEVRQDQALLKGELNKAQSVVEAINSASPRLTLRKFSQPPPLNRPRHLPLKGDSGDMQTPHNTSCTARSSSSETSSSFDFFPPGNIPNQYSNPPTNCQNTLPSPLHDHLPQNCPSLLTQPLTNHQRRCAACFNGANGLPDTCRPPPPLLDHVLAENRSPGQERRGGGGKYNSRGGGRTPRGGSSYFHKGRQQWRGGPPDYASDHPRELSRGRHLSFSGRPQSTTGINSEVSSPDLGVDLGCSDPFSSLERSNNNGMVNSERVRDGTNVENILEENRQLRQKLAESRGALRDTVDRLAASSRQFKKEQWLSTHTRPPRQQQQQQQPLQIQQPPLQQPPPQPQPMLLYYQDSNPYSRSPNKSSPKNQTPTHRPATSSSTRNSK